MRDWFVVLGRTVSGVPSGGRRFHRRAAAVGVRRARRRRGPAGRCTVADLVVPGRVRVGGNGVDELDQLGELAEWEHDGWRGGGRHGDVAGGGHGCGSGQRFGGAVSGGEAGGSLR